MRVLPATPELSPAMASAHAQAFDAPWDEAAFEDLMAGAGVFGFVALDHDPVGVVLCRAIAGEAEVLTLAVPPWARRRGVARALMAAALDAAGRAGAGAVFLEVAVDNAAGKRVFTYYDRGWSHDGHRRGAFGLKLPYGHYLVTVSGDAWSETYYRVVVSWEDD